ncbi:MAG: hypothetical protein WAM30_00920 [Candidatus Dormiibacterota bacterium]
MAEQVSPGAHDREAEGPEGLSGTFREKVISVRSMEGRLLLPTVTAVSIVIAAGILLATRDLDWPQVGAGSNGSALTTVPLPIAVVSAVAMVVGWSFVLAGALHAHLVLRILGVAVYTLNGLLGGLSGLFGGFAPAGVVTLVIVLAVPVAATGLWFTDRANARQAPRLHHGVRLRPLTFLWALGVTALIYLLSAISGLRSGDFARFLGIELEALEFVFIPVLLLAGTDFAEWAEVVSGRISLGLRVLGRYGPPIGILAVAVGIFAFYTFVASGLHVGLDVGATLLALVPVAFAGGLVALIGGAAMRRGLSRRVPFWALVAGAVVVYLSFFGAGVASVVSGSFNAGPATPPQTAGLVTYQHRADPVYSVRYPVEWRPTAISNGVRFTGVDAGRLPVRFLVLHTEASGSDFTGVLSTAAQPALGVPLRAGGIEQQGPWQRSPVDATLAGTALRGTAWSRQEGRERWTLVGLAPAITGGYYDDLFTTLWESWSPELPSSGSEGGGRGLGPVDTLVSSAIACALLLAGGLLLLLLRTGERATGGLFLVLCAVFLAADPYGAGAVASLLHPGATFGVVGTNLVIGWAAGSLVLLVIAAVGRRWVSWAPIFRLVLVLGLGLVGLEFLFSGVFGTALSAGARFSLLQGVVLLLAMLWDVLMSGESMTNSGGRRVPRHSRVLLYLGYTVMVVTTVLFLSSEQVVGGGSTGSQFESDQWPQLGIGVLGPPLLLTFLLVNLAAWRRHGTLESADGLDQVDHSELAQGSGTAG